MKAKLPITSHEIATLWEQRLNSIPTVFGRIVYMAQQRRLYGRYTDADLAAMTSPAICQRIIRDAHVRLFRSWLALSIEEQAADLKPYLQTLMFSGSPHELRLKWSHLCRDLIPSRVSATEINLFLGTAQTLLKFVAKRRSRSKV